MKNIHILPTEKPSRLYLGDNENFVFGMSQTAIQSRNDDFTNQNIYITSDEEIKEGDWCLIGNKLGKRTDIQTYPNCTDGESHLCYKYIIENEEYSYHISHCKKIILTTDQDLIADGVQAIDDEFLEWFVKNPSCEFVEVKSQMVINYSFPRSVYNKHEIIIPQEEPKQDSVFNQLEVGKEYKQEVFELGEETLEEIVKPIGDFIIANAVGTEGQDGVYYHYSEVCKLLKLQSKRMYSEEDMKKSFIQGALTDLRNTWDISKEEMAKEKFNEWLEKIKKEIE
jgi:hypothetical protein